MKFGLAARLSWVLVFFTIVSAGLTSFYLYQASHSLLVANAKAEMLTSTVVLSKQVAELRKDAERDLGMIAEHPAALKILQQDTEADKEQLATLFSLLLKVNPDYLQVRLISVDEGGLERVRVDKQDDESNRAIRVHEIDLQEKGHFPYVHDTLKLGRGQTYLSPIVINHELGAHAGVGKPTAQFATPVVDPEGRPVGVVVINLDLNRSFGEMISDLPKDYQLWLANSSGDYLIHPDPSKTFGFDRGQRILLQDEFAQTSALISGTTNQVVLDANTGRYAAEPIVAVFIANVGVISEINMPSHLQQSLIIGLARPLENVVEGADDLGKTLVAIIGGFALLGIVFAVILSRIITLPINRLSEAAKRFAESHEVLRLPKAGNDEVGTLVEAFTKMRNEISQQINELFKTQSQLARLARHDTLTGLPNRRMFVESLEATLEQCKLTGSSMALLFIDLNKFKDVNDNYGHGAGDATLQAVAGRLVANARSSDIVARLGGDEFVVILKNIESPKAVEEFCERLHLSMREAIYYSDLTLQSELSIGVSIYPTDGTTVDQLIGSADAAMYDVKKKRLSARSMGQKQRFF